jgi:magnesium chelatase subunit I
MKKEGSMSPATLGELKRQGYEPRSVKEEMRRNLVRKLSTGETLFPGIVGYEKTVLPAVQNAVLSRHDFLLLGLRGQAKTRILRGLTSLLDEKVPVIAGCPINDSPFSPICRRCRKALEELGDRTPVGWLSREERYHEKLATPDVSMADLIGDIDPIKAANERLSLASEEVMHFGIIPRSNRGIFAINELPDLNTRIQVGLLNILEERDIQIRGFPVRMALDLCLAFTANPEDYTSRGRIITPLKDRIDSQIATHYPQTIEDSVKITAQEAWIRRSDVCEIRIPDFVRELVEQVAFQARKSEFVDQASGVSARLSISALENVVSNIEKRALATGEKRQVARVCDVYAALPAVTGKIELVYEGEQQGMQAVAKRIIGAAITQVFSRFFPGGARRSRGKKKVEGEGQGRDDDAVYRDIVGWFAKGNVADIGDLMPTRDYVRVLEGVEGLKKTALAHLKPGSEEEIPVCMEFLLEGLFQNSIIAKEELDTGVIYKDMLKTMFESIEA